MSDAPPERFALARRGLPLPAIKPASLRSAWLPSAVRSPAVSQAPDPETPAAPAPVPQATGNEPWWMEAADWVPRETSSETALDAASPNSNLPGPSTDTAVARAEQAPGAPRRGAIAEREILHAIPKNAPDGTQRSLVPGHLTGSSVDASTQAETNTTSTTPAPPASAPRHATQRHASDAQPDPAAEVKNRHTAPERERVAPPAPPTALGTFKHLYKTIETAVREHAPLAWPTLRQVRSLRETPTPETAVHLKAPAVAALAVPTLAPRARANPAQARATLQPQAMGMPHERESANAQASASASGRTRTTPADMAALLSPTPRRQQQVYIDQIAVTVQAPPAPATPPAAPKTEPASLRAPSAGRGYRNPWSGYHARRD